MRNKFKLFYYIFTVTFLIFTFSATGLAYKLNELETIPYKNEEHSFTLNYPKKLKPIRLLPYEVFHVALYRTPALTVSVYKMAGEDKLDLDGFFEKIKELYPKAEFKNELAPERSKTLSDGTPAKIYAFSWDWPISGDRKFLGFQYCIGNTDTILLKSAVLIASKNGKNYACLFTILRAGKYDKNPPEWLFERVASFDFY